jgi:hypothetical protein
MKLLSAVFVVLMGLSTLNAKSQDSERIKDVVNKAYVEAIHNNGDLNEAREGFHPEFQMFVLRNGSLSKVSINDWIQRIENGRNRNQNTPSEKASAKYLSVDVTQNVASVKLELHRGSKLLFTDYLYLYKIGNDWKIVSKVYHAY